MKHFCSHIIHLSVLKPVLVMLLLLKRFKIVEKLCPLFTSMAFWHNYFPDNMIEFV